MNARENFALLLRDAAQTPVLLTEIAEHRHRRNYAQMVRLNAIISLANKVVAKNILVVKIQIPPVPVRPKMSRAFFLSSEKLNLLNKAL